MNRYMQEPINYANTIQIGGIVNNFQLSTISWHIISLLRVKKIKTIRVRIPMIKLKNSSSKQIFIHKNIS
jgi:hypothetical protein